MSPFSKFRLIKTIEIQRESKQPRMMRDNKRGIIKICKRGKKIRKRKRRSKCVRYDSYKIQSICW